MGSNACNYRIKVSLKVGAVFFWIVGKVVNVISGDPECVEFYIAGFSVLRCEGENLGLEFLIVYEPEFRVSASGGAERGVISGFYAGVVAHWNGVFSAITGLTLTVIAKNGDTFQERMPFLGVFWLFSENNQKGITKKKIKL